MTINRRSFLKGILSVPAVVALPVTAMPVTAPIPKATGSFNRSAPTKLGGTMSRVHVTNMDNPHYVTREQVGLGRLKES